VAYRPRCFLFPKTTNSILLSAHRRRSFSFFSFGRLHPLLSQKERQISPSLPPPLDKESWVFIPHQSVACLFHAADLFLYTDLGKDLLSPPPLFVLIYSALSLSECVQSESFFIPSFPPTPARRVVFHETVERLFFLPSYASAFFFPEAELLFWIATGLSSSFLSDSLLRTPLSWNLSPRGERPPSGTRQRV